ncbi:MAG: HD domain-containing protein [Rhodospirillales bacterium]|nr:HD domain-containing protein [Rhodospirillales bacterium]MCB9995040.1 HD domain-containing protein [Rhodospirillales bacterium]
MKHSFAHDPQSLQSCLDFIREIDALKTVERKTKPMSIDRQENSAEHSWHLAMMALVLGGTANEKIDLNKVIRMLLIHDIPEVYAGDVFVYDRSDDQAEKEREAADRLFGMLPDGMRDELRALWEEFEAGETAESRFARALDRFQPCMCNFHNDGGTWQELGISRQAVERRNAYIADGSAVLWDRLQEMLETADERGYFPDEKDVNYA